MEPFVAGAGPIAWIHRRGRRSVCRIIVDPGRATYVVDDDVSLEEALMAVIRKSAA